MASVVEIMGCSEAVSGEPRSFRNVAEHFASSGTSIKSIEESLADIRFGDSDEFRGEAANAFAQKIAELDQGLDDLVDICRRLDQIFDQHAQNLALLRREASEALARARVDWNCRDEAAEDRLRAQARVDWFEEQIYQLDGTDPQVENLRHELRLADNEKCDASSRVERANRDLEVERQEWNRLRGREQALIDGTCSAIASVDLGVLADPSLLQQLGSDLLAVFNLIVDLPDLVGDFIREHQDFLVGIYDWLENVTKVLSYLAVLMTVTGFLGPLVPWVTGLLLLASIAKLAIGVALVLETDSKVSVMDVVFDGIAVAGAAGLVGVGNAAESGGWVSKAHRLYEKSGHSAKWADKAFSGAEKFSQSYQMLDKDQVKIAQESIDFGLGEGVDLFRRLLDGGPGSEEKTDVWDPTVVNPDYQCTIAPVAY